MNNTLFTNSFLDKDLLKGKKVLIEIFHPKYGNVFQTIESYNVKVEEANIKLIEGIEATHHFLPNTWDIVNKEEENEMRDDPDILEKIFSNESPDMHRWRQQSRMEKINIGKTDFEQLYRESFLGKLYNNIRSFIFRSEYCLTNYFCCLILSLNKADVDLQNKKDDENIKDETSKIISENKNILGKLTKEISEDTEEIPIDHYEELLPILKDII